MTQTSAEFLIRHADDNLVLAQRLSQYITRAPDLEQDIAVANFALDHLGVATHLYDYAADVEGGGANADAYAMTRSEREFRNVLLVEQPHADYAHLTARSYFFDRYQTMLWPVLATGDDERLAGIAGRAAKEARYHLTHSRTWLMRLGDGTEESHRRMQAAVDEMWRFTAELFEDAPEQISYESFIGEVTDDLEEATLLLPSDPYQASGGREGWHSEHLGHLLGEMQWMARSHPGASW